MFIQDSSQNYIIASILTVVACPARFKRATYALEELIATEYSLFK